MGQRKSADGKGQTSEPGTGETSVLPGTGDEDGVLSTKPVEVPELTVEEISLARTGGMAVQPEEAGGTPAPPDPARKEARAGGMAVPAGRAGESERARIEGEIAAIGNPYAGRDALNEEANAAAAKAKEAFDHAMRAVGALRAKVRLLHYAAEAEARRLTDLKARLAKLR